MISSKTNKLGRKSFLKHKSEIQTLFSKGKRTQNSTFKSIWTIEHDTKNSAVRVFISVPKRCLTKATDRNLVKRRIKEALRLNLHDIKSACIDKQVEVQIGIVYTNNIIESFNNIESKIVISLQNIYSKIYENEQEN